MRRQVPRPKKRKSPPAVRPAEGEAVVEPVPGRIVRCTDNGAALRISDFVYPSDAVKVAIELYGSEAQTTVAYCALEAHYDRRSADFRCWSSIFRDLTGAVPFQALRN